MVLPTGLFCFVNKLTVLLPNPIVNLSGFEFLNLVPVIKALKTSPFSRDPHLKLKVKYQKHKYYMTNCLYA